MLFVFLFVLERKKKETEKNITSPVFTFLLSLSLSRVPYLPIRSQIILLLSLSPSLLEERLLLLERQLPGVFNSHLLRRSARGSALRLDGLDDVHSFQHFPEDDVLAVEPGGHDRGDEELGKRKRGERGREREGRERVRERGGEKEKEERKKEGRQKE